MWYKLAQITDQVVSKNPINNFSDRNHINNQIRELTALVDDLYEAYTIANQTQSGSRQIIESILNNRKISSFPDIIKILNHANKILFDSPSKAALLCQEAATLLSSKISRLIDFRREFAENIKNPSKIRKGLF